MTTQKVIKFIKMMKSSPHLRNGKSVHEIIKHQTIHEIIHYGCEGLSVNADENVIIIGKDVINKNNLPLSDMTATANVMVEISRRKQVGDFILCFWGADHKIMTQMFSDECIIVEPHINYSHDKVFAPNKIFESYAWAHHYYGLTHFYHPGVQDAIIPNYFDPNDYSYKKIKKNYFLYIGKTTKEAGAELIILLAKKLGFHLIIIGQGNLDNHSFPCNIEYLGYVSIEKKRELLSNATALFSCSETMKSFGTSCVEAMMSGTPVITSDHSGYSEIIIHDVTGYRCHTVDHYEWAINNISKINPETCRRWALDNYSIDKVRTMYHEHFDMLLKIKFNGGSSDDFSRDNLDWLQKKYPDANHLIVKKPSIALITETKWAFGRIASALQKYSKKFNIRIFDWQTSFNFERISKFDLIYTTVWDVAQSFEQQSPNLKNKLIFTGHGMVDFIKFDSQNSFSESKKLIDNFTADMERITWMNNRKVPFNVVSHEIYDKLAMINGLNLKNIIVTQNGVDSDVFQAKTSLKISAPNGQLKVVFTFPEVRNNNERGYGYDAKRKYLIADIKKKIMDDKLPIELIFTERSLHISEMSDFYHQGDVYLTISHSEGNPLGIYEAGICGLVVIATRAGETPYFVNEGETGFLIDNGSDEQIMQDVINRLMILANDRDRLQRMKNNIMTETKKNWTWESKIDQWDNYFLKCLAC